MAEKLESLLKLVLSRWVNAVRRIALWVVLLATLAAGLAFHYTVENLGINTDTADMISDQLPWRRTYIQYEKDFPQSTGTLLLVIEGVTPDLAEQASRRLAALLEKEDHLIQWVYRPGGGRYFEEHGFLYLDLDELEDLADNLARVQPFLAKLTDDPSLRGLFGLIGEATDAVASGEDLDLVPVLNSVSAGVESTLDGRFYRQLSWQELMLGRPATPGEKRRFIVVKPRLDYSELLPAGPVMERIRALAREQGLDPAHGVRMRITGGVALDHEELQSVSRGIGVAGILALALVGMVLLVGLGSLRLVVASLITLVIGLIYTAAFATLAIGYLNLISVAFAVLYIGLGVAYAIHFCLRYRELIFQGWAHATALVTSAQDVGGALVLCAVTTGIGFFAFVPTDYSGVSELGVISGTGMFIALTVSLTVLPALLTLLPLPSPKFLKGRDKVEVGAALAWDPPRRRVFVGMLDLPYRFRRPILWGALLLGLGALSLVPLARFDYNPLNLRDPTSESVATYRDLMAESDTSPWSIVIMARDEKEAEVLKGRLESLDVVDSAVTLQDFIPDAQEDKLSLVEEIGLLLGPEVQDGANTPPPDLETQITAIKRLIANLKTFVESQEATPLVAGARRLYNNLRRLEQRLAEAADGSPQGLQTQKALLRRLQTSLLGSLPEQSRMLDAALRAGPVSMKELPIDLVERWVAPDGAYRVEVFPKEDLNDIQALRRFVSAVRRIDPDATESPVLILESGNAVVRAFQEAFLWALVLITLVLVVILRRGRDVLLALAPLVLAGALTVAGMVLLDIPFNFANVIALPLLLGVGVDNGIHMVERVRMAPPSSGNILQTSTARAVVISALTTICSFGNLALSPHLGTASIGMLLTIGLGFTVIFTLVVLPALIGPVPKEIRSP